MVLDHADNVTLRGLRFHVPQVPFGAGGPDLAPTPLKMLATAVQRLNVAIGVHPVHCAVLTVEDCLFRYTVDPNKDCFGAGIFAQSECWGHRIRHNRFVRDEEYLRGSRERSRTLFGYLLATSLVLASDGGTFDGALPALLQDGSFRDNAFSGLTAAVAVIALTGVVEIESNTVRDCLNGFILLPLSGLDIGVIRNRFTVPATLAPTATTVVDILAAAVFNPALHVGSVLARIYPPPQGVTLSNVVPLEPRTADLAEEETAALLTDLAEAMATQASPASDREQGDESAPVTERMRSRARQATQEAARLGFTRPVFDRFMDAQAALARLGRATVGPAAERPFRLSVHLAQEDVQTLVGDRLSGFGLLVFGDRAQQGDLTMVGCRYLGQPTSFLVAVGQVNHCAISGNAVLNEAVEGSSLGVMASTSRTEGVAVSGNVLQGRTFLPPRPLPPPLDTWDVFNAES